MSNYWKINALECYPQFEGRKDIIINILWNRFASKNGVTIHNNGAQAIMLDPKDSFTPYNELTEAQVIGWLESAMGSDQIAVLDADLDRQLNDLINPPIFSPPLPWANEEV